MSEACTIKQTRWCYVRQPTNQSPVSHTYNHLIYKTFQWFVLLPNSLRGYNTEAAICYLIWGFNMFLRCALLAPYWHPGMDSPKGETPQTEITVQNNQYSENGFRWRGDPAHRNHPSNKSEFWRWTPPRGRPDSEHGFPKRGDPQTERAVQKSKDSENEFPEEETPQTAYMYNNVYIHKYM